MTMHIFYGFVQYGVPQKLVVSPFLVAISGWLPPWLWTSPHICSQPTLTNVLRIADRQLARLVILVLAGGEAMPRPGTNAGPPDSEWAIMNGNSSCLMMVI